MSMHKIKPSEHEEEGLRLYGLPIGSPSQLSDCFRNGFAWANHCAQVEVEKLESELKNLRAENAKLIAERDMLKLCADHNEDEVKKKHSELDAMKKWYTAIEKWRTAVVDECIRAGLPVDESNPSVLIEKLIAERDDILKRDSADKLAENGDMYADVYCQIVDLIDPYVKRGFNDSGELPASVVHSVEFLFEFWIKHKAEREAMMKQEPLGFIDAYAVGMLKTGHQAHIFPSGEVPVFIRPLPAQHIPEGYALADKTELKKIHRDLDSCQKVIWLAGGFDPSYCKDAQESLQLIDAMLSASQPKR